MSAKGHNNFSAGNGKTPMHNFALESAGFTVAELASVVASLGVVGFADTIAPGALKSTSKAISKAVIEPHLDVIESTMSNLCKLEACKTDKTVPREDRAEKIAHTLLVFGAAWVGAFVTKVATRRIFNEKVLGIRDRGHSSHKWWKLSNDEKLIIGLDEGIHYGSLLLLNTGAAVHTDAMINTTSSILEKAGLSKEKSKELAGMSVIWELPNLLGLFAGMGGIYYKHHHGEASQLYKASSHVDRLANETSLSTPTLAT